MRLSQLSLIAFDYQEMPYNKYHHILMFPFDKPYVNFRKGSAHYRCKNIINQFTEQFNEVLPNMDDDVQAKVVFLLEQLYLLLKPVNSRRYSCDLIATATTWLLNSPSLYNQLPSEVLTIPVPNYIKRLPSAINVDFALSKATEVYLGTRFDHL